MRKLINHFLSKIVRVEKQPIYIPVLKGELLLGKNVLITGGTRGIGFAIAEAAIANGANVIITGTSEESVFVVNERLINNCNHNQFVKGIIFDLNNFDSFKQTVEEAVNSFPNNRIDSLVNNAGVNTGNIFGETRTDDFDRVVNTNLKGLYFFSQVFSNYLIENKIKGNILNISSVSGVRPTISPYMITKRSIIGLTEGMAKKLIRYGIVVNGIAPGPTSTDFLNLGNNDLKYDKSPSQRFVDPMEIANLAVFLLSETGRMIVGDTIIISGGCGNLTFDDMQY